MGRKLILDTNVLIAFERGAIDRGTLDDDELAVAAITCAEFRVGIELAGTPERAAQRAKILEVLLGAVEVLDYTQATAVAHARLLADVRRSGRGRGAHDLVIAAHASETGRTVLSADAAARFGELPGVIAEEPVVTTR